MCIRDSDVIERFMNPFIKHSLLSIAMNYVSKFRVRVLPSILEYVKEYKKMPERRVCSLASLIMFYRTDEANDDADVMSFMKTASVKEILVREDYWGESLAEFEPCVQKYIDTVSYTHLDVYKRQRPDYVSCDTW